MSDVQALNKICKRYNIFSIVVDLCMDSNRKDEHFQNKISTSLIKEKLRSGDLSEIERLLGSKYFILGNVVKGKQIARKINFPTANINLEPQKALLKSGVYAVHVAYKGKKYLKYIFLIFIEIFIKSKSLYFLIDLFVIFKNLKIYNNYKIK